MAGLDSRIAKLEQEERQEKHPVVVVLTPEQEQAWLEEHRKDAWQPLRVIVSQSTIDGL